MTEKWEYKVINITKQALTPSKLISNMETELNELGQDGWELVSADGLKVFMFKRRLS